MMIPETKCYIEMPSIMKVETLAIYFSEIYLKDPKDSSSLSLKTYHTCIVCNTLKYLPVHIGGNIGFCKNGGILTSIMTTDLP